MLFSFKHYFCASQKLPLPFAEEILQIQILKEIQLKKKNLPHRCIMLLMSNAYCREEAESK